MDLVRHEALGSLHLARKRRQESRWRSCRVRHHEQGEGGGAGESRRVGDLKEKQLQVRSAGVVLEGSRLETQKAQERPPLLSPGKKAAMQGHMVSVAIEAKEEAEGASHLVKGV
ncbi:hypothetical protein NDU88_005419 [Pleurodeles waltl]|uniref:Uncharacterized protein n=1 Tax=Pleurodeles waltl TaxID=8319 RepID=A0AAV7RN83_PLEWA|nr:hypothetical protein NDU88_005419 [Pleurodeles waltl]